MALLELAAIRNSLCPPVSATECEKKHLTTRQMMKRLKMAERQILRIGENIQEMQISCNLDE
jgi:hypothetical protein